VYQTRRIKDKSEFMTEQPITFTDRVRAATSGIMTQIGATLHRWGVHPDLITFVGLVIVAIGAVFIGSGRLQLGGVILLAGLPLDAVDGATARAVGRTDKFGAAFDSSLDRYADGFIFGGLSYYFAHTNQFNLMLVALAALMGSYMVSYVRARAEGLDLVVKVGLFTRLERITVILVALLLSDALDLPVLEIGLWALALGTNFTALQRLLYVRKLLIQDQKEFQEVD
jgi:phosphatidylglycerophosphate synthase